jgi:hypothetical protein
MRLVRTPAPAATRFATAEEVADLELAGTWVVDVRREPRPPVRAGWLVDWEDDIVFLMDPPSELDLPLDAA